MKAWKSLFISSFLFFLAHPLWATGPIYKIHIVKSQCQLLLDDSEPLVAAWSEIRKMNPTQQNELKQALKHFITLLDPNREFELIFSRNSGAHEFEDHDPLTEIQKQTEGVSVRKYFDTFSGHDWSSGHPPALSVGYWGVRGLAKNLTPFLEATKNFDVISILDPRHTIKIQPDQLRTVPSFWDFLHSPYATALLPRVHELDALLFVKPGEEVKRLYKSRTSSSTSPDYLHKDLLFGLSLDPVAPITVAGLTNAVFDRIKEYGGTVKRHHVMPFDRHTTILFEAESLTRESLMSVLLEFPNLKWFGFSALPEEIRNSL